MNNLLDIEEEEISKLGALLSANPKADKHKAIRNLEKEISALQAPGLGEGKEITHKVFDRDARWTILKRQIESGWEKEKKKYKKIELYLEIADRWISKNKEEFEDDWRKNNGKRRKKGEKERTQDRYLADTYWDVIRKAVGRFENKIAAVFP